MFFLIFALRITQYSGKLIVDYSLDFVVNIAFAYSIDPSKTNSFCQTQNLIHFSPLKLRTRCIFLKWKVHLICVFLEKKLSWMLFRKHTLGIFFLASIFVAKVVWMKSLKK